eukprot:2687002-Prymnesium_polylepis.1
MRRSAVALTVDAPAGESTSRSVSNARQRSSGPIDASMTARQNPAASTLGNATIRSSNVSVVRRSASRPLAALSAFVSSLQPRWHFTLVGFADASAPDPEELETECSDAAACSFAVGGAN